MLFRILKINKNGSTNNLFQFSGTYSFLPREGAGYHFENPAVSPSQLQPFTIMATLKKFIRAIVFAHHEARCLRDDSERINA